MTSAMDQGAGHRRPQPDRPRSRRSALGAFLDAQAEQQLASPVGGLARARSHSRAGRATVLGTDSSGSNSPLEDETAMRQPNGGAFASRRRESTPPHHRDFGRGRTAPAGAIEQGGLTHSLTGRSRRSMRRHPRAEIDGIQNRLTGWIERTSAPLRKLRSGTDRGTCLEPPALGSGQGTQLEQLSGVVGTSLHARKSVSVVTNTSAVDPIPPGRRNPIAGAVIPVRVGIVPVCLRVPNSQVWSHCSGAFAQSSTRWLPKSQHRRIPRKQDRSQTLSPLLGLNGCQ